MNKEKFILKLTETTTYSKEECEKISDIIDNHFIIGKNNKEKMIKDFQNELSINYEEADELYNASMEIIMTSLKNKIVHPFRKED